jgi:hypothetical protein
MEGTRRPDLTDPEAARRAPSLWKSVWTVVEQILGKGRVPPELDVPTHELP